MTGNLLGEPFDPYVRDQIELRQEVWGRGYNDNRTPEQIQYLNNRNAWIKMASSVSISSSYDDTLKEIGFTNPAHFRGTELAEKAILFNGLSQVNKPAFNSNSKSYPSGSYGFRSGVVDKKDLIWNQDFAYGLGGTNYGIQPMPGITDFSVEAINRGSIRKGTVNIKAFNKFQFELIELLYIRLGFTMLIEWGWDRYFSSENQKLKNIEGTLIDEYWFTQVSNTHIEVIKKIHQTQARYEGNYDAFFGRVSNFDWKFNTDGSYDIILNLISVGDVIESLKIINKTTTLASGSIESFVSGDVGKRLEDSNIIKNAQNDILNQYLFLTIKNDIFSQKKEDPEYVHLNQTSGEGIDKYEYYMTFKELLIQIENNVIPTLTNSKTPYPLLKFETSEKYNICNAHPDLISPDPRVCVIKPLYPHLQDVAIKKLKSFINLKENPNINKYNTTTTINSQGQKVIKNETIKDYFVYGKIMNIYLNYDFISQNLKSSISDTEFSIYDFLTNICNGINKCFGGVTNLEPVIKDDYIITIIDQNTLPEKLYKALGYGNYTYKTKPAELEVYGFNPSNNKSNFIKNIGFKTKITPELSSMITIGATADGTGTKNLEATAFSKWNYGLEDRYNKEITQTKTPPSPIIDTTGMYTQAEIDRLWEEASNTGWKGWGGKHAKDEKDVIIKQEGFEETYNNITKEKLWEDYQEDYKKHIKKNKTGYSEKDIYEYKQTWDNYVTKDIKGKYFHYNENLINEGLSLWESTYKDFLNQSYKDSNGKITSNTIGFIPLTFDLTLDGISGIKIYQQLNINQNFLPRQYPKSFKFLISKVNHKISNNTWETQLNTISTSNIEEQATGNINSLSLVKSTSTTTTTTNFTGPTPNADRLREVLNTLRYEEKDKEISSGGDITPQTADMGIAVFKKIKELYPNLVIKVTGGNDLYHQQFNSPSRHKTGSGLDFTIIPILPQNISNIENILKGFSVGNNPNFRYINEYSNPTQNASGKHFHISWGVGTEGQDTLQLALNEAQQKQIPSYLV